MKSVKKAVAQAQGDLKKRIDYLFERTRKVRDRSVCSLSNHAALSHQKWSEGIL